MISFATEFPTRPLRNRAEFIAQVVGWLRGTNYSTVLDQPEAAELLGEAAQFGNGSGEELRFRELQGATGIEAIGFRHDFPDGEGRLWRTEMVLRRGIPDFQDLIRLRTDCIAKVHGARLDFPRKPYLIKAVLEDGWGGKDGELPVTDKPVWLGDDTAGLNLARAVTIGDATSYLPVVYVSTAGRQKWLIPREHIERLAFELGGVAHVVVEPSQSFSFRLREAVDGANAYGGTVAVAIPGRGIIRRFYVGLRYPDVDRLLIDLRGQIVRTRSQLPAHGWDWTELQEQALRRQRERDRNRLSAAESEQLYVEEISNLRDRVAQLEGQLAALSPEQEVELPADALFLHLAEKLGPEIYPGEFTDRIRFAAKECGTRSEQIGLDERSKVVLNAIVSQISTSPALEEIRQELRRATKDQKRMATSLVTLLSRHGYKEKSDNKHIRLEPVDGYRGLSALTISKTPGDQRGMENMRKQIEGTLGITKL